MQDVDASGMHVLIEYEGDDGSNGRFSIYVMPFKPRISNTKYGFAEVHPNDLKSYEKFKIIDHGCLGLEIPVLTGPISSVTVTR